MHTTYREAGTEAWQENWDGRRRKGGIKEEKFIFYTLTAKRNAKKKLVKKLFIFENSL